MIWFVNKKAYLVQITSFDIERKIQAIKRIREVTGFGLEQAKNLIESCPAVIIDGLYHNQAKELSKLLSEMGMKSEIKKDENNSPTIKNLQQIDFSAE